MSHICYIDVCLEREVLHMDLLEHLIISDAVTQQCHFENFLINFVPCAKILTPPPSPPPEIF